MTASRDSDRLIRDFLAEGPTELPDRVYDDVRSDIDRTRQRAVFGPWRAPQMSNVMKFGIAAAALMVAVVAGITFVGPPGPTPTPLSTPAPTQVEALAGPLAAGTYVFRPFVAPNESVAFTLTVPDGWQAGGFGGRPVGLNPTTGDVYLGPTGMSLGFLTVTSLESDPCHWDRDNVAVGPKVNDLVSALAANSEYDSSEPAEVSLGGYDGKKIDIQVPAGLDLASCDSGQFVVWAEADGQAIYAQGDDGRFHLWILDVEGHRVVVMTHDFPGTSSADLAELQAIVDSIRIDVAP